ncbi:hypothetical protein WBJ53_13065 [Spirosoma sp. SC4-14]|uniref:hypothetical protein n=1 Tax=Spirosoma sp. SC4-14 TaxID=3128900 RepID=UPI0030CE3B77
MSFNQLQIRFQTARSLPAPYAYFYTLRLKPLGGNGVQVDLAITYPDRDDIDDDELIAEGYTRDDDFQWAGQLPKPWLQAIDELVAKTAVEPLNEDGLDEDDEFWEIALESKPLGLRKGQPANSDSWQYLTQELIQAAYEAIGRERPFELIYLDTSAKQGELELHLVASFADRTVRVTTVQNRHEQTRTLPWATLQQTMAEVYNHDYDPDEALQKRPRRDGQWLNLGSEEWYNITEFPALSRLFQKLSR